MRWGGIGSLATGGHEDCVEPTIDAKETTTAANSTPAISAAAAAAAVPKYLLREAVEANEHTQSKAKGKNRQPCGCAPCHPPLAKAIHEIDLQQIPRRLWVFDS